MAPTGYSILDWAFLGHLPNTLAELQALALSEQWEFQNVAKDPNKPLPILYNYLYHTFGRLVLEKKVVVNETAKLAAINTGLVDHRYEPVYILFEASDTGERPWQRRGFCIPGEDANGQNLVRYFNPLPRPPHYFDHPADLLYDTRMGEPELDWRHLVVERIDRFPAEFIEDHWPRDFPKKETGEMGSDDRKSYYRELGIALENDTRRYRMIMNRVKDAVHLVLRLKRTIQAADPASPG